MASLLVPPNDYVDYADSMPSWAIFHFDYPSGSIDWRLMVSLGSHLMQLNQETATQTMWRTFVTSMQMGL
jgi:hypothetical protein